MRKLYYVSFLLLIVLSAPAIKGNERADSLLRMLAKTQEDTAQIKLYHEIGFCFEYNNPDSSRYYHQKALELSTAPVREIYNTILTDTNAVISLTKTDFYYLLPASLSNRYIGFSYTDQGNFNKAISFYKKALRIAEFILSYSAEERKEEVMQTIADNIVSIGLGNYYVGNYDAATECFTTAMMQYAAFRDSLNIAKCYTCFGMVCREQTDRGCAVENYHKALEIYKQYNSSYDIGTAYGNLAHIYMELKDFDLALEYYENAKDIFNEINMIPAVGKCYNGMGIVYEKQEKYAKAEEHYHKYLEISEDLNDTYGISSAYTNLAILMKLLGDYPKSLEYYAKSYKIDVEMGNKHGQALVLNNMSLTYKFMGEYDKSIECAKKSLKLSEESGRLNGIRLSHEYLSALYDSLGDFKNAYYHHWQFKEVHDSIFSERSDRMIRELEEKYQANQRRLQIESLEKEKELQSEKIARTEAENQKQRLIIWFFILGFLIIVVFAVIIFRLFLQKKKAYKQLAQQNEEIAAQRDEIETQRDMVTQQRDHIEEIHKEITASISYAKRIQAAVLPSDKNAADILGEHFIIFRPHSVVSGDFYWTAKTEDWTVVTVADCTGHGVPGAFMSMLGVSFLNEIVRKKEVTSSAEVLNNLRSSVIEALKQTGNAEPDNYRASSVKTDYAEPDSNRVSSVKTDYAEASSVKDGMDMSIVAISNKLNTHTRSALWAGANNPLWIIRYNENDIAREDSAELVQEIKDHPSSTITEIKDHPSSAITEIKGDKMPVAVHIRMDPFTNHEIRLNKGDQLYLFTDGYPDQFGGPKGKKYKYKPFKKLLIENSSKPMPEQKQALEAALDSWMNTDSYQYEQVDDITVVGLKI